ncbi:methionyl-tRNA formyltransferase [Corynebacterium sp. MSK297]|uniref:methionyl-tRNA formyltransferase n=1 Tax=Corynebacterium sp. MSK297 TaxID=3050221 RepID=UPI00254B333D|nr:methionyl-tRNA formyltransferase [Corynebacterium sp. MSK297]MDK8844952.1 methionyl-tRNA formyltransferase [Corynebacterium sp. MSK297]
MRIVFAGTPEPAVVALEALLGSEHDVVGVLTRPDARQGRGRNLAPSPVAAMAQERGIEVLKPETLRAESNDGALVRDWLRDLAPEAIAVVAYGKLISPDLLSVARHGWINLHFSLLPHWRGAAPVQAAIAHGDDITGASTFRIEEGLDTGDVLGTVTEAIRDDDTADDLLTRLAYSGADLLVATMDGLADDRLEAQPQTGESTYAPKISADQARIDWAQPDFAVDRHVRAYTPGPGAWTMLEGQRLKISPVTVVKPGSDAATALKETALLKETVLEEAVLAPGEILVTKNDVFVGTATTPVRLGMVQAPGKKKMDAADWARGSQPEGILS